MLCKECHKNKAAYHRSICNTCKSRRWRLRNPLRELWHNIKRSAKKRNKEFNLDFDKFKLFVKNTGYDKKSGRGKNSSTIDRINNNLGYTDNNIQVLTRSKNTIKYFSEDVAIPF